MRLNERQAKIINILERNDSLSPSDIHMLIGEELYSRPTINRDLVKLLDNNIIKQLGSGRTTKYSLNRLKYLNNIKIYSEIDNCSGVISFNLNNCDCNDVANFLDKKYNIAVRSGLHCAPLIHKQLGTIEQGGAIRISLTHQNNANEIDRLIDALIDYQNSN